MGHHPDNVSWTTRDDKARLRSNQLEKLTDEQCNFINNNVGVSRRTLRDVSLMFNEKFETKIEYSEFLRLRSEAISAGRCRTTYFRNYYKGENSSERELRKQKSVLKSRLIGGCQYQDLKSNEACGVKTTGRYCEAHVRAGHKPRQDTRRGADYIDSSLGKYG